MRTDHRAHHCNHQPPVAVWPHQLPHAAMGPMAPPKRDTAKRWNNDGSWSWNCSIRAACFPAPRTPMISRWVIERQPIYLHYDIESYHYFPSTDETFGNLSEQTKFAAENSRSAPKVDEPNRIHATFGRSNHAERCQ